MNKEKKISHSILKLVVGIGLLLMIPLIGMQFSEEVNWTGSDFIIMGGLIFLVGLTFILITHNSKSAAYKIATGFGLFTGFFLIWVNGAVGIIGSENNDFNLYYFIVIAVGLLGVFASRFKAKGMGFAMIGMAITQAIIAVVAIVIGMQNVPHSSVMEIIGVNGFFIFLFILSALLFRYVHLEDTVENEAE